MEQRDLASAYAGVVAELEELAQGGNAAARLAQGTVPRWFAALPCDKPFSVYQAERGDWGDKGEPELVISTPVLAWDWRYPMERWLLEQVRAELAEGRRVMVYFEQNAVRSMSWRLQWVLEEFGPWTLPNGVEAEDRQQAIIEAVQQRGARVIIVPYLRVNEGLNLQTVVDTIIWAEMPKNLFLWTQASQRAWRLGKENLVRVFIPYYIGSAAHKKVRQLGGRDGAASAFAGEPARGGLVHHVGADQTTLARLSAQIEAGEQSEDALFEQEPLDDSAEIEANFARRNKELAEVIGKGRQWFGLEDTLPERLEAELAAGHPDVWAQMPRLVYLAEADLSRLSAPVTPETPEVVALEDAEKLVEITRDVPLASTPGTVPSPAPTSDAPQIVQAPQATPRLVVVFGDEEDIVRVRRRRGVRPPRTLPKPTNPTTVKHIPAEGVASSQQTQPEPGMEMFSIWDMADAS